MKKALVMTLTGLLVTLIAVSCEKDQLPTAGSPKPADSDEDEYTTTIPIPRDIKRMMSDTGPLMSAGQAVPSPLITVQADGRSLQFWPYTGTNFEGTPQDPINLIFYGEADPRDIRAALLALDGDRSSTEFPVVAPFTETWRDCIGDVQTSYGGDDGWAGAVVQLALGDYMSPRFHIRLFKIGKWTVANTHFEVLIPGTTDHQVLSWELAEQLVLTDFLRSGLLDAGMPLIPAGSINEAPFHKIPAIVYNGLPVELRMLIEGPLSDVTEDVDIKTDGQAYILNLVSKVPRVPDRQEIDFVVNFDQVIPKPFCSSGPHDYVYVTGPVTMRQASMLTPAGNYVFGFIADGDLVITAFDPMTQQPTGEPLTAKVLEYHGGRLSDRGFNNSSLTHQRLLPADASGAGWLFRHLRIRSRGGNGYREMVQCADASVGESICMPGSGFMEVTKPEAGVGR